MARLAAPMVTSSVRICDIHLATITITPGHSPTGIAASRMQAKDAP
jgi:hypothetical protein